MNLRFIFLYLFIGFYYGLPGQTIVGLSTVEDHHFGKWEIITNAPDLTGVVEGTWVAMNDWSEWQYALGDHTGWIKLRNKNDPNLWEVIGNDEIIHIRTIFPNEFNRWEVNNGRRSIDVETIRSGDVEQWEAGRRNNTLFFYTYVEGDRRDWIIENNIPDLSVAMQLAITFIPILHVVPRQ